MIGRLFTCCTSVLIVFLDLDNAINKYTEAMKLVKECDKELKDIEIKVTKIVSENNELKDFEVE